MLSDKIGFYLMRKVMNKSLRDLIVRLKVKRIGKAELKGGRSAFIADGNEQTHIDGLSKLGYTILDHKLDSGIIDGIVRYSEQIGCYDVYRSESDTIDPKKAPIETHVGNYRREDLVRFKPIMEIANDPGVLKVVREFLGATPTISNVNMWWSFGGRKQAEHAQLFHRDVDDWRFCKLFIYLTDVSPLSGPHIYVRGTSQSPEFRAIRRYSDVEIERKFGKENILEFTGKRGTAFIVDTYGFHKGLLPKSDDRLLLQIQYSLYPIGVEKYFPVKSEGNQYDAYINRLLCR